MARRPRNDPEPTLFPFLSVLAAVMGTLILVISGMAQINMSQPKPRVDVERFDEAKKVAIYVECRRTGLFVYPDEPGSAEPKFVKREQIGSPSSAFVDLSQRLELDSTRYVMFLIRPEGVGSFEDARALVAGTRVEYGYEPLFGVGDVRFKGKALEL